LIDLLGISTYALLPIARRFAAGRLVGASSDSEASRSLEAARFFDVVERPLVARCFIGSSSSDVGGDSASLREAGVLNIGDTLVVPVPEVEDGDARLRADRRVTRGIAMQETSTQTGRKEIFFGRG
jgi:hypothetical protein